MEGAAAVAKEVGEEVEVEVAKGMAEVAEVAELSGGREEGGKEGYTGGGRRWRRNWWWRWWGMVKAGLGVAVVEGVEGKEEGEMAGGKEVVVVAKGRRSDTHVLRVVPESKAVSKGFELLANYWAPYLGYLTNPSGTYFGLMLKNLCCNGYTVDGGAVGSTVGAEVGTLVVGWVVGEEVGEAVLGVVVGSGVVGCKVVGVLDVGALVGGVDGDEVGTAVVGVVVGEVVGEAVGVAVGVEEVGEGGGRKGRRKVVEEGRRRGGGVEEVVGLVEEEKRVGEVRVEGRGWAWWRWRLGGEDNVGAEVWLAEDEVGAGDWLAEDAESSAVGSLFEALGMRQKVGSSNALPTSESFIMRHRTLSSNLIAGALAAGKHLLGNQQ
ncbi:hypothetical protein CYMTET_40952 [Cymbomonas tetramitiformis]|uniref:Uncharacterized protein n=1 Tax=Cymbomonas tetramitiformis TaxID=36881 RepID=A0AAE0F314_9CHLO|nr:hypothetical protein CYMTET_40952 [Cymbomonas tetramitiformis]